MKAIGLFAIVAGGLVAAYAVAWFFDRRRALARWRVEDRQLPSGDTVVELRRGQERRHVRTLPGGMDHIEFVSEHRLARDDADSMAEELNRE